MGAIDDTPLKPDDERAYFQSHLQQLGYQLEQTNPIFDFLLGLYKDGVLYEIVQTAFLPMFVWKNRQAEVLLEPYKVICIE